MATAKLLLPQTFWFRFALACRKFEGMPRMNGDGGLLALPEATALPDLHQLDGQPSWAQVRVGWNSRGLGISVIAEGVSPIQFDKNRPEGFALAQFWVDTRDTRNVSRATRFCHRFVASLVPAKSRREVTVKFEQKPIARAISDAPLCRADVLSASAQISQTGWLLEVFLPAEALHGYDPETSCRLGFAVQVADYVREDQFLGVGREFPVGENPSLWSTLELRDEAGRDAVITARPKKKGK
jgi:hypothetical protein